MISFVGTTIFGDGFSISLPPTVAVLAARFICSILMHLQVEADVRNGLNMMKYVSNQPFEFSNPGAAFMVACMQTIGGLMAEIWCLVYLCSMTKPIDVIIRFVALSSIAKVDDFYGAALPKENKIKKSTPPLPVLLNMRDWQDPDQVHYLDNSSRLSKDSNLLVQSLLF